MNSLELLYETEDLLTDEGVQTICEKIHCLDVSRCYLPSIWCTKSTKQCENGHFNFCYPLSWTSTSNWTNCWAAKRKSSTK